MFGMLAFIIVLREVLNYNWGQVVGALLIFLPIVGFLESFGKAALIDYCNRKNKND